jgi:spore germination protein GerM
MKSDPKFYQPNQRRKMVPAKSVISYGYRHGNDPDYFVEVRLQLDVDDETLSQASQRLELSPDEAEKLGKDLIESAKYARRPVK